MATDVSAFFRPASCANTQRKVDGKVSPCKNVTSIACKDCKLVQYCSAECQSADRVYHNPTCQSAFMKEKWTPRWVINKRKPAFVGGAQPFVGFGANKFLWGNMPAIDVLNVAENEGMGVVVSQNLNLLFAASGDIRNVVKTITALPENYQGHCTAVLNDREFLVAARNVILLMTAFIFEPEIATPIMIQLWYSALLPSCILAALQADVLPLIGEVCDKIKTRTSNSMQAKSFQFESGSLRVVLKKEAWTRLAGLFKAPDGLTGKSATTIRHRVTLAPERVDYLDRHLLQLTPAQRETMMHFRRTGILFPFGCGLDAFDMPNPTFFQDKHWPMKDYASPLHGWNASDYMKHAQAAKGDDHGALFNYLEDTLHEFCSRTHRMNLGFTICNEAAVDLPPLIHGDKFDRIEISNICDRGYMGPEFCIRTFGAMLKDKTENPKATLIFLFMNATMECYQMMPQYIKQQALMTSRNRVDQLLPINPVAMIRKYKTQEAIMWSPETITRTTCYDMFLDFDTFFQPMLKEAIRYAIASDLRIKTKHSIIDKWPYRVKDGITRKEFKLHCAGNKMGYERYMELERVA